MDKSSESLTWLDQEGGAYMMFRETPPGGWIFSSGSEAFFGALDRDAAIAQVVRNLVADVQSSRSVREVQREFVT